MMEIDNENPPKCTYQFKTGRNCDRILMLEEEIEDHHCDRHFGFQDLQNVTNDIKLTNKRITIKKTKFHNAQKRIKLEQSLSASQATLEAITPALDAAIHDLEAVGQA